MLREDDLAVSISNFELQSSPHPRCGGGVERLRDRTHMIWPVFLKQANVGRHETSQNMAAATDQVCGHSVFTVVRHPQQSSSEAATKTGRLMNVRVE